MIEYKVVNNPNSSFIKVFIEVNSDEHELYKDKDIFVRQQESDLMTRIEHSKAALKTRYLMLTDQFQKICCYNIEHREGMNL